MSFIPKVAIVAITRPGMLTARKLLAQMPNSQLYVPSKLVEISQTGGEVIPFTEPLSEKLHYLFQDYDGLVLFMALGAAFRLLAPCLKDKRTDPAMVVVDDAGKFAISALSGHKGGANELSRHVAKILNGQAVITTASDVIGTLSLDLLGKEWGWQIENEENLTQASAALVNGESVAIFQDAGEETWWPLGNISGENAPLSWPENITLLSSLEEMLQGNFAANIIISDKILSSDAVSRMKNTVVYRPKNLVAGIGCKRGTPMEGIEALVTNVFLQSGLSYLSIRNLASIDIKNDEVGLLQFAQKLGVSIAFYSKKDLDAVEGVSRVCEPAALISAGMAKGPLLVAKHKSHTVTVAVARINPSKPAISRGKLNVVGLGPGDLENLTYHAREAIKQSRIIIGYKVYIELISEIITGKEVVATGMMEEVKRAGLALDLVRNGKIVALVSSGDAGIYGMAGLVWELMRERGWKTGTELDLEIVPGVSALNASASLLGAPLSQDFAAISLSDLLIPWETIEKRLKASARADMVIVLYNPKSQQRTRQIEKAQQILLTRRSPRTPVGIVTNAYRKGQRVIITDLAHFLEQDIDMLTTIIIGNSQTFVYIDKMVTPRGYKVGNLTKP